MHLEKVMGEISTKISLKLHILACYYDRVIRSQRLTVIVFLYKNMYKDLGIPQNVILKEESHSRLCREVHFSSAKSRRTSHALRVSRPLMLRFNRVSVL